MHLNNKRLIGIAGLAMAALILLACDAGTLVAQFNPPTPTPSRTPRPTFTPRPAETDTPEPSPTPETTDTPEPSPTPTKRAVTVVRTATKPAATPIPAPKFAWTAKSNDSTHGKCATGVPVFEVEGRVWSGSYIGGIHIVAIDKDGKIVAQMDTLYPDQQNREFGVSCFEDTLPSYKLDLSAGWVNGPLTLRLTKSAGDLTPISPDVQLTFDGSGGRYYIDFVK